MSKIDYPTSLDEIDQWLFDSFGILPGCCSSIESVKHTTARMVAEALWPKNDKHWSEEDEDMFVSVNMYLDEYYQDVVAKEKAWLELIKNRLK